MVMVMIDTRIYEAEWAYIPSYSDITAKRNVTYDKYDGASCGAVVSNVGGHPDRNLTWKNVYCTKGGKYVISVHCKANQNTKTELIVNGKMHTVTIVDDSTPTVSYLVTLKKGNNEITFGNSAEAIPMVDYMALEMVK